MKTDDALVSAIRRLLDREPIPMRINIDRPKGYWSGKVGHLLGELTWDDEFAAVVDRPHDSGELRRELKKRSKELHGEFGIVVTMANSYLQIEDLNHPANKT